eukprot:scaffold103408_cov127-Cyclotella_meneghiniana.AAC.2
MSGASSTMGMDSDGRVGRCRDGPLALLFDAIGIDDVDVVVGVSFCLRWMTQTDIVDEIYDGRDLNDVCDNGGVGIHYGDGRGAGVGGRGCDALLFGGCRRFDEHMLHVFLAGALLAGGVTVQGAIHHCVELIDNIVMIDGES